MKSGFVAILGRPNVGKSTLMNHILNQKISIVTDKSQTTRNNIKGIYTTKDFQIIFVDTPGIHKPYKKLGQEMNTMAYTASHDVDVNILVIDSSLPFGSGDQYLFDHLGISETPLIICFNKIDLARIDKTEELKKIYKEKYPNAEMIDIVAKDGFNIDSLVEKIVKFLPEGPCYYDEKQITDSDEVFLVKEIIREKLLKTLKQEVPHSAAIYMNDINWESNPLHIIISKVFQSWPQFFPFFFLKSIHVLKANAATSN